MLKVVMIHEVTDDVLSKDLSDFDIITFDDGLYSQYTNISHFLKYNKPLYFFITTDIVCPLYIEQNKDVVSCSESHRRYREDNDRSNYMKWSQIKELYNTDNCFIGGHSHTHPKIKYKKVVDGYNKAKDECECMMNSFRSHNINISSFCFPFNENFFVYKQLLTREGIDLFFGKERIPVENI